MESHSYIKPDGHSIKSSPKLENECLWQFWLVFGEFLEINGKCSQNSKTSVKMANKTHLYVKSDGDSKKCSPEARK